MQGIKLIDQVKNKLANLAQDAPKKFRGLRYCDVRLEVWQGKSAVAENGQLKSAQEDVNIHLGIRVLSENGSIAPGYFGQIVGEGETKKLEKVTQEGIAHAFERAKANVKWKSEFRKKFGELGSSLEDIPLAPVQACRDKVPAQFKKDPLSVPLTEVTKTALDISKVIQSISNIRYNYVTPATFRRRQLFVSSEGAEIDQDFAITQASVYAVAFGKEGAQNLHDAMGHQAGWEVCLEGVKDSYTSYPSLMEFAKELAKDAAELADCPVCPTADKEVTVVTDPHYNTLLSHEIVGHPTEMDRALKMEVSYAGRSWLLNDLYRHQIGKRIGSELLNAFSDPTMSGLGSYKYDDEGTPAKRVSLIERGIFKGFMNSRQTAAIFKTEPNGSYIATEGYLVPLIRMTNTVFGPGKEDPKKIIEAVEDGYYLAGHKTPSIAESRENFRITAKKVYEIKNGRLGRLYRNGGITADTKRFFMNIDAVGSDFQMYAILTCGKGMPMQTKRMSNGGPTLRSVAKVVGGS